MHDLTADLAWLLCTIDEWRQEEEEAWRGVQNAPKQLRRPAQRLYAHRMKSSDTSAYGGMQTCLCAFRDGITCELRKDRRWILMRWSEG